MPLLPAALYGLRVPAGDEPMPAAIDFPATVSMIAQAVSARGAIELSTLERSLRHRNTRQSCFIS